MWDLEKSEVLLLIPLIQRTALNYPDTAAANLTQSRLVFISNNHIRTLRHSCPVWPVLTWPTERYDYLCTAKYGPVIKAKLFCWILLLNTLKSVCPILSNNCQKLFKSCKYGASIGWTAWICQYPDAWWSTVQFDMTLAVRCGDWIRRSDENV